MITAQFSTGTRTLTLTLTSIERSQLEPEPLFDLKSERFSRSLASGQSLKDEVSCQAEVPDTECAGKRREVAGSR